MKYIITVLILILSYLSVLANTDIRKWQLADNVSFNAELISYNVETGEVSLGFNDSAEGQIYQFSQFSDIDRAWLIEWIEFAEALDLLLKKSGGEFEYFQTQGEYPTDVYVYYPSVMKSSIELRPAMFLFNAGGKAKRYMKRHIKAAEACNLVLVALGSFRNSKDDNLDSEFSNRFEEIFPALLEKIKFDADRLFMGGNSGGALRAFQYSVAFDWPWAGIYSNGGWLGDTSKPFYENPPMYPAGMRVALVNGNNDYANWVIPKDSKALRKRGCNVALFAFEGGHQPPPFSAQQKAFNWLLEQEDFIEE